MELGNEEDEEPLEAEIPIVRMTQDMLSTGVGVPRVSKAEVLVDNIELNYWKKKKEKGRLQ